MKFAFLRTISFATISVVIGTTCLTGQAGATEQKSEIKLSDVKAGPYFKLDLPLAAYTNSKDSQLSDLRLRNAKGDYLNFAWVENKYAQMETSNPLHSQRVPIFPITANANTDKAAPEQIDMRLERAVDGSLMASARIASRNQNTQTPIVAWVIDATTFSKPSSQASQLLQLRFEIPTSYEGIASFRLEASDDLQQWRQIDAHTQLVHQLVQLRHQGEQIQQLAIDLPQIQARYLRLMWSQANTAPVISSVEIDAQDQENTPTQLLWSAAIPAQYCDAKSCDYVIPRNTPVDSLRIAIQEKNTLAKSQITGQMPTVPNDYQQHRHARNPLYVLHHQKNTAQAAKMAQPQEVLLGEITAYRLQHGDTQLQTKDIALNGTPYTRIKLQVSNGIANLGTPTPTIAIGTISRSLLFLARGEAPYYLELGGNNKENGAIALAALMPDTSLATSAIGAAEVVITEHEATAQTPAELSKLVTEKSSNRKFWLWLALGVALVILSVMVWSLLRNFDQDAGTKSP